MNNYDLNLLNEIISSKQPINIKIIKYKFKGFDASKKKTNRSVKSRSRNKIPFDYMRLVKGYEVKGFEPYNQRLILQKKIYSGLIKNEKNKIHLSLVNELIYDVSHGINKYLQQHYKIPYPPSNAFTKIWEIYHTFNLLPRKKAIQTFHFAEAPGQFIWGTQYYLSKRVKDVREHVWYSNSLNPKHPENRRKFGKVFGDDYKFMRNFPNNWLWGKDETGDITNPDNILWFRKKINEITNGGKDKIDVVTGDAGLQLDNNPRTLQVLDYAQVVMVAATASIGKHSITKHFHPFLMNDLSTVKAGGFFVSYLYIYYLMFDEVYLYKPQSSNPTSGEFYVIGKYFKGINDNVLKKMCAILKNFNTHQAFFSKKRIPDTFTQQVLNFYDKFSHQLATYKERRNFFLTCLIDDDQRVKSKTKCLDYLKPDKLKQINEAKNKEWIKLFGFK